MGDDAISRSQLAAIMGLVSSARLWGAFSRRNKVFLAAICGVMLLHTTVVAAEIKPLSKNSASSVVRGQL